MNRTKKIVFISLYVALAIVLDYLKEHYLLFLNMNFGGSVNIALIPIVVCSFHLGVKEAIGAGLLWCFVTALLGYNNYYVSIMQYLLDYILTSGVVGISALFYHQKKLWEIEAGILLMVILRVAFTSISGAYYWMGDLAAGSKEAWIASLTYNVPYSIATAIVLLIVTPLIIKSLRHYMV